MKNDIERFARKRYTVTGNGIGTGYLVYTTTALTFKDAQARPVQLLSYVPSHVNTCTYLHTVVASPVPADECVQRRFLYISRSVFAERDVERRASRAFKRATYKLSVVAASLLKHK